jgi:hypothetical protein
VRAVARSGCGGYSLILKYVSNAVEETCRQCPLLLPLELGQGLSVTAVEVLEWDGSSLPDLEIPSMSVPAALVGFEVVNSSSVALFSLVSCVRNELGPFRLQPVLLGPNASRRLTLPVQCFSLAPFVPTEERPKERKASDRYVEQLAARVDLNWTSLVRLLLFLCDLPHFSLLRRTRALARFPSTPRSSTRGLLRLSARPL